MIDMKISTIQEFLDYLDSVRGRTIRVIDKIPPDKINWRPETGAFSFADIIRHIAGMEYHTWANVARFKRSTYAGHGTDLADGYDEVMAFFDDCHAKATAIFEQITDEELQQKCTTPAGVEITLWKWLRSWFEHEVHHRGQMYTYLRLIEVESPPIYGLTSEQVRENSVSKVD